MSDSWKIVGLGEILWDVFPDGAKFGGAPANFAGAAAELGGDQVASAVVSGVGDDDLGHQALDKLSKRNVETKYVEVLESPTGRVDVTVDDSGSASYKFLDDTAWDNFKWSAELNELAGQTDAVCYGTLGQRNPTARATIRRFLAATPKSALRIFDINLRPPYYDEEVIGESLKLANVLKLNDDELPKLGAIEAMQGSEEEMMRQLLEKHDLRCVVLTRGADGAVLVTSDEISRKPGHPTEVIDTVGAGDAFTAAVAIGLLSGTPLDEINNHAARLAAYVCSQPGGTPEIPADLRLL